MNTLLIDTHSKLLYISLVKNFELISEIRINVETHCSTVMPSIKEILEYNNLTINDINEIIVINGPGSFTGVRIGVTIAKTIAYCLNIPIKTITSLEALGESSIEKFDIVSIKDPKGFYSARKVKDRYVDFEYRKTKDYEEFIAKNNYTVCLQEDINTLRVLKYLTDKEFSNPHNVNPIYIKEIDALK